MTTLIIKSDSEEKTNLLVQLASELGLDVSTEISLELNAGAMITGIGRKATDEELIAYLSQKADHSTISLEDAFAKYTAQQ